MTKKTAPTATAKGTKPMVVSMVADDRTRSWVRQRGGGWHTVRKGQGAGNEEGDGGIDDPGICDGT